MDKGNQEILKDLLMLFYKFNLGVMKLNKPLRKLIFTRSQDVTGEAFILDFQAQMESIIRKHSKKSLTLRKGIPYSMTDPKEFLNRVMEELQ